MTYLLLLGDFDDFFKLQKDGQDENLALSYIIFIIFGIAAFLLQVI
jgi:hypothetical protein